MLATMFMACALFGGVLLLCQLGMSLLGLGDHDGVGDHDFAADHDVPGDHGGADHDFGADHHGWMIGVLSFRALTAALTFFGLTGMVCLEGGLPDLACIAIALVAAFAAMMVVGWMMRLLYRLDSEGTAHIENAVGQTATVYLRIPGAHEGAGKVTVKVQDRVMEYRAVTAGEALPTGAHVIVKTVVGSDTLEVERETGA